MPKQESHGIDERKRDFTGEIRSRALLAWLNEPSDSTAKARIRGLLRNIRVLTTDWQEQDDGDGEGAYLHYAGNRVRYNRAFRQMLSLLRRYRFAPLMWNFGGLIIEQWTPISGPDGRFTRRWPPTDGKYDDLQAVYELMWLTRDRGLQRIRECICGKWIFAKFSHQRFCSARCREREFKSSPESKEYRRRKAREYYWLHKNKNVK